jgi:hypothetical protein
MPRLCRRVSSTLFQLIPVYRAQRPKTTDEVIDDASERDSAGGRLPSAGSAIMDEAITITREKEKEERRRIMKLWKTWEPRWQTCFDGWPARGDQ